MISFKDFILLESKLGGYKLELKKMLHNLEWLKKGSYSKKSIENYQDQIRNLQAQIKRLEKSV